MNKIRKIILFIKNIFKKQEAIKMLEEPKQDVSKDRKVAFVESLKINTIYKRKNKQIQTLICTGDGLGIQKKICY